MDTTLPDSSSFPFMDEVDAEAPVVPIKIKSPGSPGLPPALPKKESKFRKKSQYDNVFDSHPHPLNLLAGSKSFDCGGSSATASSREFQRLVPLSNPRLGLISDENRKSLDELGTSGQPPPLPPKKRDIINYMEMLGQSLLPSRKFFNRTCLLRSGSNAVALVPTSASGTKEMN